jgi:peptide/nickel transport system substrate-binding protein
MYRLAIAVLTLALAWSSAALAASPETLRLIAQADLRVLDPIWTTATITRNYGYMVYDTLFALDDHLQVRRRWSSAGPLTATS